MLLTPKAITGLHGLLLYDWDGTFIAALDGSESFHYPWYYFLAAEAAFTFKAETVGQSASTVKDTRVPPVWSLEDGRLLQGESGNFPGVNLWPAERGTVIVWVGTEYSLAVSRGPELNREHGRKEVQLFSVDHKTGQHKRLGALEDAMGENFYGDISSNGDFVAFQTFIGKADWGASVLRTSNMSETWSVDLESYFQRGIALSDDGGRLAVVQTMGEAGGPSQELQVFDTGFGVQN